MKDTLVVPISDMHSGGTTALFPNRFLQFKHGNHTPVKQQKAMFKHWSFCAEKIAKERKGKKLIIVHDGDAIEGYHHNSHQVVTMLEEEQIEIHVELMDFFLKAVGGADELYYVTGTEVHTNDGESRIGEDLDAVPNGDLFAYDELRITVNGQRLWFVHHGPTAGKGANRGNALRNWLKNIFYECLHEGMPPPHVIVTGHTHNPDWNNYVGRVDGSYHLVRGLICPSWQQKTRFAYKAAPLLTNKIGLQYFTITKDGLISDPVEWIMK